MLGRGALIAGGMEQRLGQVEQYKELGGLGAVQGTWKLEQLGWSRGLAHPSVWIRCSAVIKSGVAVARVEGVSVLVKCVMTKPPPDPYGLCRGGLAEGKTVTVTVRVVTGPRRTACHPELKWEASYGA